jgi:uncharacterized damage-inducible protein DinB
MKRSMLALAGLLVASPVAAQEAHAGHAMQTGAVAGVKGLYDMVKDWTTKAADQVSEADYAFKPTPEVRSFGQLIGHVANANYMFCSTALGEQSPAGQNFEQVTSKAQLVQGLRASFTYCDRAYAMTDMKAAEPLTVFGREATRLYALEFNMGHDFEHYGNIVTYMRLKGLVPPSSQGN